MFSEKISSGGQRGTDAGSREEDEVDIPENTLKLHILSVVTYFLSIALIHSVKTMFQTLKLIRCSPSLFVCFFKSVNVSENEELWVLLLSIVLSLIMSLWDGWSMNFLHKYESDAIGSI